jgi:hypothetical protein
VATTIPNFLTHYYLPDRQPFLSLSDLKNQELKKVLEDLRLKTKKGESKRIFADWYVEDRKKTETFLRNGFIKKGGNIQRKNPIYFVLGRSEAYKAMIPEMLELELLLERIPKDSISFTYPDSMASLELESDLAYNKPYHGQVFTFNELFDLIGQYGYPKDEIARCSKFGFPNYIEAQVWCNIPLK